ncbi:MAG: transglycosylase SLT domain-containing protein [Acidobacteriota bacterium]|nr:transglycosylase SLT domain-containing protein [Acidobacteriota bacterium]
MVTRAWGLAVSLIGVVGLGVVLSAQSELSNAAQTARSAYYHSRTRLADDEAAFRVYRPAYSFWQHIFTIPDGSIIFGSAEDGRLLATFPSRGNWARDVIWGEERLVGTVEGRRFSRRLGDRRDEVEALLEAAVGPVVHNPTRGRFLEPHAERYGPFLGEWGAIYERFGVPAEIGLAQAIVESGLNGRARSSARALGFCQWLPRNWNALKRLSPHVIEGYNQTTQAPYCAAYLTILATMYGSFIPALSEHHAGGVNVGRTVINGERLGGRNTREQYLLGSDFARSLRQISIQRYRQLFRTYGHRSALYAEMVFGNMYNVRRLIWETPQTKIFAMRVPETTSIATIAQTTGLSRAELKRFNPALVRRVPRHANLYLPEYVEEFGEDVSFWHRPASPEYAEVLNDFVRLDATIQDWHEPEFEQTLREFQQRFTDTGTEEGAVMATLLRFVIGNLTTSRRAAILEEFRHSDRVRELFDRGKRELASRSGSE